MKTRYLFLIMIFFSLTPLYSQTDSTSNYYYIYNHSMEFFQQQADSLNVDIWHVPGFKQFERWANIFSTRIGQNGDLGEYCKALNTHFAEQENEQIGSYYPTWEYIGQKEILERNPGQSGNNHASGQGWINCLWVHPDSINFILAGSHSGGLWKTTDGGDNWYCLTDEYPEIKGIKSIEADSSCKNIYLTTLANHTYSLGLFSSADGGLSWSQNLVDTGESNLYPSASIPCRPVKWLINPINKDFMFLLTNSYLLNSIDGGESWNIVIDNDAEFNSDPYFNYFRYGIGFNDMEFDPVDPYTLYVTGYLCYKVTQDTLGQVFFVNITSSILNNSGYDQNRTHNTVCGTVNSRPNEVYYIISPITNTDTPHPEPVGVLDIYRYTKNANSYEKMASLQTGFNGVSDFTNKLQCEVSPDPDTLRILMGGLELWMFDSSFPDSLAFYPITNDDLAANHKHWTHVDIRDVKFFNDQINRKEYIIAAHDGSVSVGVDNISSPDTLYWDWRFIGNDGTNGIINSELWGFDCSNSKDDVMAAGLQDMNCSFYHDGEWYNDLGGDGGTQLIDQSDCNYVYSIHWNSPGGLHRSTDMGRSFIGMIDYEPVDDGFVPMILEPQNPNHLYVGAIKRLILYDSIRTSFHKIIIDTVKYPDSTGVNDGLIKEIAISDSDSDVIYYATDRFFGWNNTGEYFGAFKRSTDGGETWVDLTENLYNAGALVRGPVTGIAINPHNENELWVCMGGTSFSATPSNILYHSADTGQTWSHVDFPEKRLPATDLVINKSSGVMFMSNDAGIYYYDPVETQWFPTNNNLPPNIITNIRFNDALHDIRVGTFGRGVWKAPIYCPYSTTHITISSDTTWNDPKVILSDIIVLPGGKLTVKGDLHLADNSRIIVQRGAKLTIDGAKLTNHCYESWLGIEVWGTSAAGQYPNVQGWVQLINGATIENSRMGIYTNRSDDAFEDGWIPGYTGGIIQANNSSFINNKIAVRFFDYKSKSQSLFNNCTFITDNYYTMDEFPEYFARVSGMDGVKFINCDFLDQNTENTFQSGLFSYNSYIYIDGVCQGTGNPCPEWDYGKFERLNFGIYALCSTPTKFIDIRHHEFINNNKGIYFSGMTNARITDNVFTIASGPVSNYGLYLEASTGYKVEENEFAGGSIIKTGIGMLVLDSGRDPNRIYRNSFTNQKYGIVAMNKNRGISDGLQFRCNTFNNCSFDLSVTATQPGTYYGVGPNQGSLTQNPVPTDMAGNLFYWQEQSVDFDDFYNEGGTINYYFPLNTEFDRTEPKDYSESVYPIQVDFDPVWIPENGCPPSETGGGSGRSAEYLSQVASYQQKIDSAGLLLSMLVDGGSTEDMREDVEYSFPPQAYEIYIKLIETSPFLSDTVVSAAIEKDDVLPDVMIRDVMVANPQTAKSEELVAKLDERWQPFPEYMKQQILEGKNIVSAKEKIESRKAEFSLARSLPFNELVREYLTDTLNPESATDSMVYLLDSDPVSSSKYDLAFVRLEQGETQQGMDVLNDIPSAFELDASGLQNHAGMLSFYGLISGFDINQPDSLKVAGLKELQAQSPELAHVYARNVLITLNEMEYQEPIMLPEILKSSKPVSGQKPENPGPELGIISIYPNPAKDFITLAYNFETKYNPLIEIREISGKIVYSFSPINTNDSVIIDTRNWKPGNYIASLGSGGKNSFKFSIIH